MNARAKRTVIGANFEIEWRSQCPNGQIGAVEHVTYTGHGGSTTTPCGCLVICEEPARGEITGFQSITVYHNPRSLDYVDQTIDQFLDRVLPVLAAEGRIKEPAAVQLCNFELSDRRTLGNIPRPGYLD